MLLKKPSNEEVFLERAFCHITKGCYKAKINLNKNLLSFLPYLRAKVKVLFFEPKEFLIFKWFGKEKNYEVALTKDTLTVGIVEDREEALNVLKEVVNFINQVWKEKDQIVPSLKPVKRPSVLELYKYLPKTNCKACGEETCLAFATKLNLLEAELENCPEIVKNKENYEKIKSLLEETF